MAIITQKDIAEKLGVTRVLVSRALAGHESVAERTQELVRQTAREMGYHEGSNAGARALAARRNGRAVRHGVIACSLGQADMRQHLPYWAQLQQGVEEAAQRAGYRIVLASCPNDWEAADGLITHNTFLEEEFSIPVVNLMEKHGSHSFVTVDNKMGGCLATEHLLALGHSRIACLMDAETSPAVAERVVGWRATLKKAGFSIEKNWNRRLSLEGGDFLERGRVNMAAWVREDWCSLACTAILAQNDRTAIGVMQALQAAGIRVPEQVSVVGFDGTGEGEFCSPPLTTVQVPLRQVGRVGVEVLLRQIEGGEPTHHVLPVRILDRASSGAAPAAPLL